jgi:Uma2 family endonuclease
MGEPPRRRATYEDLVAAPEHLVAEIIDGELVTHPRPAAPHALAASRLGVDIGGPFDRGKGGPGGWVILYEPELHLHGDILVPDLAGWRRERMPQVPDAAAFELAPDWACEVLSPSTAAVDRSGKLPIYARERVAHVWFVDPIARTLELYRLEGSRYTVLGCFCDAAVVRPEPFDAVPLELAALWAR